MVEQFGFAMTPECHATSWGFTSGTTSGTSSSMRKALELSIMTAPAAVTASRMALETPAPAENSAISTPSKDSGVISCTTSSPAGTWPQPSKGTFLPAERALAKARTSDAGKSTSCSTRKNSCPTAPVAPATATTGFAGISFVHVMLVLFLFLNGYLTEPGGATKVAPYGVLRCEYLTWSGGATKVAPYEIS